MVLLQLKKVVSIIENDDHHFIFHFRNFHLSIIVKFSDFVEFVSKYVLVLDTIKVDVKVHFKNSPFNHVSNAFQDKWSPSNTHMSIYDVNHLGKVLYSFDEVINLLLSAHYAWLNLLVSLDEFRRGIVIKLFVKTWRNLENTFMFFLLHILHYFEFITLTMR